MKTLAESLFDKDLVSKKLDIEKVNFDNNSLNKLNTNEINTLFDALFEFGHHYNAAELRNHQIDLNKYLIIIRNDSMRVSDVDYSSKFTFIFNSETYGDTLRSTLICYNNGEKYRWAYNSFIKMWQKPTWKGQVSAMYHTYNAPSFSVIEDEKTVEKIKKGIQFY